ncbi:MAG: lactonase family protein [Melioribacteraceae bacterium]|nr:lactonase family protein [Melioribacteraceae bacterium]MCF8355043.1 lactonase family protein [Melioribacteraceae bacterium]MCF8396404.1 lactonase family protein [Melioribacteraceae bacterium]MCF8417744.1 lactonase family protein [Melioribacteraceae bacterium]
MKSFFATIIIVFCLLDILVAQNQTLFIGTYAKAEDPGIFIYEFNDEGKLTFLNSFGGIENPSYLAIDKSNQYLYAVGETMNYNGSNSGSVSAFKIDGENINLEIINKVSSEGGAPCYLSVDDKSRFVFTANYMGGNAAIFPVNNDGSLESASGIVQHNGSSINKSRQEAPHVHYINLDKQNKFAYAVDLGIDKIMIYEIDFKNGKLILSGMVDTEPGAGPRHLTFHPNKRFAYVINELNSTITHFEYNEENGQLTVIKSYKTLPDDFADNNQCADIHVHPSGKFLYGSNRGHNSIVIYEINETTGELNLVGYESTRGDWPRNFTFDNTGKFLLAANQNSGNIIVFKLDEQTGMLSFTGEEIKIDSPVCLKFLN